MAGAELEWQNNWSDHWQSRLALTHIFNSVGYAHSESNNLLGGSLSYDDKNFTCALLANYQSSKRDSNEQENPADITTTEYTKFDGRMIIDAHLSYLIQKDVSLYLHADNLLNQHYLSPASRPANFVGVPGAGREIEVGLRWRL